MAAPGTKREVLVCGVVLVPLNDQLRELLGAQLQHLRRSVRLQKVDQTPGADPKRQLKLARAHGRVAAHDVLGKLFLQGANSPRRHQVHFGRWQEELADGRSHELRKGQRARLPHLVQLPHCVALLGLGPSLPTALLDQELPLLLAAGPRAAGGGQARLLPKRLPGSILVIRRRRR